MRQMARIGKRFDITISKKFPDGGLLSVTFGSSEERELRDDISFDDIEAAKKELFNQIHNNTLADIKIAVKTDPTVRSVWKEVAQNLKREKKVEAAEQNA